MTECFHCGLPADPNITADISGVERSFCCPSCQMVAQTIDGSGLGDFYQFRDKKNQQVDPRSIRFESYDLSEVQESFVQNAGGGDKQALLSISGISCAACAWLIEHCLMKLPAVKEAKVNASNYTCRVVWQADQCPLSEIFFAISEIGYLASPYIESEQNALRKQNYKNMLMRLGVAGIGMMQVGMYAIALHAGAIQGMEDQWLHFFRWVSLLVATPVVLFSARPFFTNAIRGCRNRQLNMDVPVALAIGLSYIASIWATLTRSGEVYYDSISMFTFFLLLGRFFEMRIRHSSAFMLERMSQFLPHTVVKVKGNTEEVVALKSIRSGDTIAIAAGEVVPCDGFVIEGEGSADESLLSGESDPQKKSLGDSVWAGSTLGETRLLIRVENTGDDTKLADIEKLTQNALFEKPRNVVMADRLAGRFILFVLLSALSAFAVWTMIDAEKAFWISLAILVATCPCALSLATPTALTAGTLQLKKQGLLVSSADFIEKLKNITYVVFDKTGTLTEGELSIAKVKLLSSLGNDEALQIVAAIEAKNHHPIAKAFATISFSTQAENVKVHPGQGVSGQVNGIKYYFGHKDFACPREKLSYPGQGQWQLLAGENGPLAWVLLQDRPRENVTDLVQFFQQANIKMEILSGDREENVASLASTLGIEKWRARAMPESKWQRIAQLQEKGERVLMLGDGINDVPSLSGASASIAVGESTHLAQSKADAVLMTGQLQQLVKSFRLTNRVHGKIKQNLAWALIYNVSILPAAAMGFVPPYVAAIGMSLSSLLVVLNAMRIQSNKN